MTKTTEPVLLPCPFCGGEARMEASTGAFYVSCDDCGSCSPVLPNNGSIAAWNTRTRPAPSPDVAGLVERVARALAKSDGEDPDEPVCRLPGDDYQWAWQLYADEARAAIAAMQGTEATTLATLSAENERLASFIMHCIEGEPSQSQGAVDTAIRIMTEQATTIGEQLTENEQLRRDHAALAKQLDIALRKLKGVTKQWHADRAALAGGSHDQ